MAASQPRIAVLSVHSCPVGNLGARDTGGMSIYVRELARELGKQGFLVDVYTRVHEPNDKSMVTLGRNARLIHLRAGKDENIHKLAVYHHLPDFARNLESFRKRNESVAAYTDVRKLLDSKEVDAVVVTTPNHWHAMVTI